MFKTQYKMKSITKVKHKRGYYDVFVRTCASYPSKIAIREYHNGEYNNYTYSELYGVCEYISQNLQQISCNKGVIGLVSERNLVIPCVIAAAHKCCTTFMFLDPSQNIEPIANEIKFRTIVTITSNNCSNAELLGKRPDKTISVFDLTISFYSFNLTPIHSGTKHLNGHSFIAMTSGTTGDPKHIQIPVQCIQPNIDDLTQMFEITSQDVIYFSTPLTFDPSMVEILLACLNGASLLIAPEEANILFPINRENSITVWQTTPSKFFQLSNADIANTILSADSTLRVLALGGEPMNGVKRLKELKSSLNSTKIFGLYGVTEMSCWACVTELDLNKIQTDREVPLGNCLSETQIQVHPSNENKNIGNIMLSSQSRRCVLLSKQNSNEEESSLKWLDTGDVGEVINGTIYYRGRKDDVIKRFGHKVNLLLIESTIMQCPKVKTCSCVWIPKPMLLVVYFSSELLSSQELSDFLKCKIDDKHWPDKIIRVNNLPMNPHGKVSKNMLSKMHQKSQLPIDPTEESLKTTVINELKSVLGQNISYDEIKDKDFIAIGGTSFLAVTMCNKLSLYWPQLAKLILPHLISQNKSIKEIINIAIKECVANPKRKRKLKSCKSGTDNCSEITLSKKGVLSKATEYEVVWTYDTGKCVDASPTLFQSKSELYVTVGSHSGRVLVADAISGTVRGVLPLKTRVEAAVFCFLDCGAPRGVVGGYDGTVACFSLLDAQECWRTNVGSMVKSRATCNDGLLYVATYSGTLYYIDVTTGEIKGTISISEQAISADLVLAKRAFVLVGSLSGACAGVQCAGSTVAWRGVCGGPLFAAPALCGDDKYVIFAEVGGEIHCRTVEKGIKIWKYQGAKGNIFSSFYVREVGRLKWQIVFGCHDSKVYSVCIKNFQPSLHWTTQMSSPVYATPCGFIEKYVLAVTTNGRISIMDVENGIVVSEFSLPGEAFSSPAVFGEYIFVGCRNDYLYTLKCVLNA